MPRLTLNRDLFWPFPSPKRKKVGSTLGKGGQPFGWCELLVGFHGMAAGRAGWQRQLPPWQRRTNVWRGITSPATRAMRPRSMAHSASKGKNTNGNETRADRHRCDRTRRSCHCDRRPSRNHLHKSWVLGNRNANQPPWRCLSRIALREPPRRWEAEETGANNQGILVTPQVVQARCGGFLVLFPASKQKSDLRSGSRA